MEEMLKIVTKQKRNKINIVLSNKDISVVELTLSCCQPLKVMDVLPVSQHRPLRGEGIVTGGGRLES